MSKDKNKLYLFDFALLWCGAAISISEIITGGLLAPLGFKKGLLAILLGHIIGTTIFIFAGIIGTRENVSSMESTKISFGLYGSYIFSILNILQLVGWTAIMINTAAQSMNMISKKMWSINNIALWSFVIALLIIFLIASGMTGFKKINSVAVILLFILTLVLGYLTFKSGQLDSHIKGNISFGAALELVVTMPLSWLPMVSDYTKFAASEKGGAFGSFFGYFIGSSWMFIIGLASAIVFKNSDPSFIMLSSGLGIIGFGIVILSTVTTTFMDAYSAGFSLLNIVPKLNEKIVAIIITLIGAVISLTFNMNNYSNFLYAIGSVFAPLFAILLTDYFIKKHTKISDKLIINFGAVIIWILGIITYYAFIKFNFILGATLPSMIITGTLYFISWRHISKWKLMKN